MWGLIKEALVVLKDIFLWWRKKKKTLKEDLDSSEKISLILANMLEEFEADRATVFQFHNGEYFYTGHSIDKMSNTHEVVTKGVSKEQMFSSGIFTSPFRSFMRDLLSSPVIVYSDVESVECFNTKTFFIERGAKSVIASLLRDGSDRPVGFIGFEYVKRHEPGISKENKSIVQAARSVYDLLVYGRTR